MRSLHEVQEIKAQDALKESSAKLMKFCRYILKTIGRISFTSYRIAIDHTLHKSHTND
jgi:hypothetical protein